MGFPAQSLFVRLLTLVDDFGRFDGRASVIHGQAFAVWNEEHPDAAITPQECAALCAELVNAGLVALYSVDSKRVMQITQWSERARADKSKWPCRQNPAECLQGDNIPQEKDASLAITSSPLHPRHRSPPNPQPPEAAGGGQANSEAKPEAEANPSDDPALHQLLMDELWERTCAICRRDPKKPRSALEMQVLSDAAKAGISESDMRLVERYHRGESALPKTQRQGKVLVHTLLPEFHAEVSKARRWLEASGGTRPATDADPWPEETREWLASSEYAGGMPRWATWAQVPGYVRDAFAKRSPGGFPFQEGTRI